MTKEVTIYVCGIQHGSEEKTEITSKGSYYFKRDKQYLVYEEKSGDSSDITKNLVRFDNKEVSITKSGAINTNMIFREGSKIISDYATPYGSIKMGFDTQKVIVEESDEEIRIDIKYALETNGAFLANCETIIKITGQREDKI